MNFLVAANTDVGTVKTTNQDSLDIKVLNTVQGKMVFAILCDGMGGLANGEVASAALIHAFDRWAKEELPALCRQEIQDNVIREQWEKIIEKMNQSIKVYGGRQGVKMGTTVAAILITEHRYYILNVGDSRIYEIKESINQLTTDQTVVEREVARGNMTREEAKVDTRRNVLLQCVGASDAVYPELVFGETKKDSIYLLCSDGFRHELSSEEIFGAFSPQFMTDSNIMFQKITEAIEENKRRGERDNITAGLIRTF